METRYEVHGLVKPSDGVLVGNLYGRIGGAVHRLKKMITPMIAPKVCVVENGKFSWFLHTDGKTVPVQGMENTEFLLRTLESINYTISTINCSYSTEKGLGIVPEKECPTC